VAGSEQRRGKRGHSQSKNGERKPYFHEVRHSY
jgi:hypothetical protein